MLKIFVSVFFSLVLVGSVFCVAEEGLEDAVIEALVVPDASPNIEETAIESDVLEENEALASETIEPAISAEDSQTEEGSGDNPAENIEVQNTDAQKTDENNELQEDTQNEVPIDTPEQLTEPSEEKEEAPSAEVLEAQRAEEAELRELGAGEEPVAE